MEPDDDGLMNDLANIFTVTKQENTTVKIDYDELEFLDANSSTDFKEVFVQCEEVNGVSVDKPCTSEEMNVIEPFLTVSAGDYAGSKLDDNYYSVITLSSDEMEPNVGKVSSASPLDWDTKPTITKVEEVAEQMVLKQCDLKKKTKTRATTTTKMKHHKGKKPKIGYEDNAIEYLKEHGYNCISLKEWSKTSKVPYDCARKRLNELSTDCQKTTDSALSSKEDYRNTMDWLEAFKSKGLNERDNYDLAQYYYAIAHEETHPDPADLGGINLKDAYLFMYHSLMGLPMKPLDAMTAAFINSVFKELE